MKQENGKGICLVLGGGGARGAFHLGLLHYLEEKKIKIDAISGSSIGAFIGAGYASGIAPKKQLEFFKSKEFKKLFRFNIFKGSLLQIDTNNPILRQLFPLRSFEQLQLRLTICAFDITHAKKRYFNSGELLQPMIASASLPLLFKPVKIQNSYYVDGGLVDNLPTDCFDKKSDFILTSNLHPSFPLAYKQGLLRNLKRSMMQAWLYSSRKGAQNSTAVISSQQLLQYPVLKPSNFDTLFTLGYEETKRYFEKNRFAETR